MAEQETFYLIIAPFAALSMLSCASVVLIYYRFEELQQFTFRLVRDLAVLDLLHSGVWLIPPNTHELCMLQGVMMTLVSLMNVLWTAAISHTLFSMVVRNKFLKHDTYETRSILLVVCTSLFLTLLPFVALIWDEMPYGEAGGWCWIRLDDNSQFGVFWRVLNFYGPLVIVFCFNSVVFAFVVRALRSDFRELVGQSDRAQMAFRLFLYPLSLGVTFLPSAILRTIDAVTGGPSPVTLQVLAGALSALHGFFDSVIYGLTRSVRQSLCRRRSDVLLSRL